MKRAVGVLVALLAGAVLMRVSTSEPPPPPPGPPPPLGTTCPWWPLEPDTHWRYAVVEGSPGFRTRSWKVARPEKGGVRVLEFTDGAQSDDFVARAGPGDAVRYREFAAAEDEVQFFPEALELGTSWRLKENHRARATDIETVTVPGLPVPVPALRVEYEIHYAAGETDSPGWYTEGVRWFARGVGMVREDLLGMQGPPEARPLMESSRREMVLKEFHRPSPPGHD